MAAVEEPDGAALFMTGGRNDMVIRRFEEVAEAVVGDVLFVEPAGEFA